MSSPLEKLAILIPTRNRPEILATTLAELKKAGLEGVTLWVYDDCSIDPNAIPRVVESWTCAKVLRGAKRVGQAEGRNVLMKACGREFGLLIDDDSFPVNVSALVKHLVEPRDSRRAITTFQYLDVPSQRFSTPKELGEGVARTFQGGGSLFHIPTVMGLGGFRSFFVYGYEEPELSMRIQLNGFHIWYDPAVIVHHNHFETPNECRDYREYDYLYARNSILMSSLNLPLWLGLPHGLARSVRRSFFRKRHFAAKLRGTWTGIGMTFSHWPERTACSRQQAFEWIRFQRQCAR
jgi:GT2 family glycosyltransferase